MYKTGMLGRSTVVDDNERAVVQLDAIRDLQLLFGRANIGYWLFGGWAVDFHLGHITRAHADIDIAVWMADVGRVGLELEGQGWRNTGGPVDQGYTCYERDDVRLDVAFLARDDDGVLYTPLPEGRGSWPDASFADDIATLEGVPARVVTLSSLIIDKSESHGDAAADAKDRADVAALRALVARAGPTTSS
ncbi:MAG: hypothetical protein LC749_08495 [Actinobacteria bacterium]|nr:hypothetical protein [Actinomycetota bacterium]